MVEVLCWVPDELEDVDEVEELDVLVEFDPVEEEPEELVDEFDEAAGFVATKEFDLWMPPQDARKTVNPSTICL